jgi:hypothetical protein
MFSPETEATYQHYMDTRIDRCFYGVRFEHVALKAQAALTLSKKYCAAGLADEAADKAAIEVIETGNDGDRGDFVQALERCDSADIQVLPLFVGGNFKVQVVTTIDPWRGCDNPNHYPPFTVTLTLDLTALNDTALGRLSGRAEAASA